MAQPVIHWFRRDLRLMDNIALHEAINSGQPVVPVFIFDDTLLKSRRVGAPRVKFMLNALHSLNDSLASYGARLVIRRGDPVKVLSALIEQTSASAVYFNADYSPYARKRDDAVIEALDVDMHAYDDALLLSPGSVLKDDGDPYRVFTPFKKTWNAIDKPERVETHFKKSVFANDLHKLTDGLPSLRDLGFDDTIDVPEASEQRAKALLGTFIEQDIKVYDETRNALVIDPFGKDRPAGTSYLSPYLRLGLLSPRQAYWAARDAYSRARNDDYKTSVATWVSELTWREFYMHILYHYPHVMQRDFVDTYESLKWADDNDLLQAWKDGKTGYPVVDAPMRQLKAIGWMPNRARMIVASFLTKDLLIYWKHGDIHFMQHLIDGDPAANNGGWQWAAGTGTDAQPYFRIFNPISQSEKYASPDYLRHWIPELANVPDKYIHAPWTMDEPPANYPAPIVDHKEAREATIAAFKAARGEG
ncbi:MAG: deoxyribodipyrimidine photo-lyase [Anaerolineaceae bacterium]|nr:deoxyribodipyrimidine photo-lyase [Anaerolineaceae bacterium]